MLSTVLKHSIIVCKDIACKVRWTVISEQEPQPAPLPVALWHRLFRLAAQSHLRRRWDSDDLRGAEASEGLSHIEVQLRESRNEVQRKRSQWRWTCGELCGDRTGIHTTIAYLLSWSLSPWGSPYTIWTLIERRSKLNKYEKGIEFCHLDYRPTSVKQLLFKIMYTMEYHNIIMLLLGPLSSPQTLCFWPFYPICFLKIGTLLWVKKQLSIKALGL